ncbi:MAG: DNA oxidative demethylase AlkB [Alphaproteobacteria bacterium]|nr:DNA oxidative demethylase AlkB [Alphaproteobacteria bacterium]
MSRRTDESGRGGAVRDLLGGLDRAGTLRLAEGAALLRGFAREEAPCLLAAVAAVAAAAPFRRMVTPGGYEMSVAMTNCGAAGWVTDRRGYRYDACDPESGRPWPPMPAIFRRLAGAAAAGAGFAGFAPDVCLLNRYAPGAKLSLHQDKDERDFSQPIVSVSLGLPAVFLFGGARRGERPRRFRLECGDVVVWGGPARLAFHGIEPLAAGEDPRTGPARINLTFRKAL